MDKCGFPEFVIMMKGMKDSVRELVLETKRKVRGQTSSIRDYKVSGYGQKTAHPSDEKER